MGKRLALTKMQAQAGLPVAMPWCCQPGVGMAAAMPHPEMPWGMHSQRQPSPHLCPGSRSEKRAAEPREREETRQGPECQRIREQIGKNLF